jgi:hypothetical protein
VTSWTFRADEKTTYDGALYRKAKTTGDAIEAGLIYLKNYRERLR